VRPVGAAGQVADVGQDAGQAGRTHGEDIHQVRPGGQHLRPAAVSSAPSARGRPPRARRRGRRRAGGGVRPDKSRGCTAASRSSA
jgi:hypothetical protein